MQIVRLFLAAIVLIATAPALAANQTLLIQLEADGRYKVWHGDGETSLNDDELVELWASAKPEGGPAMATSAGPATAVATPRGVVVLVPNARADKSLLLDRDNCGAVKVWHAEGTSILTDDQLTELVLSALPGGSKPLPVGDELARSYTSHVGVVVLIWKPRKR